MDILVFDCGGVPVDSYAIWAQHLVAARNAETTIDYKKAKDIEKDGIGIILTEQEFFDTMDGKFTPPENPNKKESTGCCVPASK